MRGLMRNKRAIFYKNYVTTEYAEDSQGRKTGRKKVKYSDVKVVYGTVSTPTGSVSLEMFGTDKGYNKLVVLDSTDIELDENSVFWLDKQYVEGQAHDYVVTKILKNANFLTIGLRKVDVGYAETNPSQTNEGLNQ